MYVIVKGELCKDVGVDLVLGMGTVVTSFLFDRHVYFYDFYFLEGELGRSCG